MPKGPNGEKRPADAVGLAVMIGRIATGEIEDDRPVASAAAQLGQRGGKARAVSLSSERRREIARQGAQARWETPAPAQPGMKARTKTTSE